MTLDELEALAKAATPGPWVVDGDECVRAEDLRILYDNSCRDDENGTANAAFVSAANPAAVLDLIARLRAAEADAQRLDWLAQGQKDVVWRFCNGTGSLSKRPRYEFAVRPFDRDRLYQREDLLWRPSLREAIDTARAAEAIPTVPEAMMGNPDTTKPISDTIGTVCETIHDLR